MKENQMEVLFHSNGYDKGVDLLTYSTSELCHENGSETNLDTLACGLANMDDFLNIQVAKNSESPKNGIEIGYVQLVHNQGGPLLHPRHCEKKSVESLASRKDNDENQSSPKLMPSVIIDGITPCSERNSTHSEASSRLLGSDLCAYTDKNVVECELPELDVPSNVHIVKDICVDTGVIPHERMLIESNQDDHAASFASQPTNEDLVRESVNRDLDTEVFFPDQFEGSSVEDTKKKSTNIYESWVTFDSVEHDESKSSVDNNTGPKMDEQSLSSSDSIADIVSEEASSISSTRVSEEFKMQDSLLNSLKQEGNKAAQQADEVPSLDTILESLAVMFTSKDSKKEDLVDKLSYNSKVEGGTITFDFKSSKPDVPSNKDGNTEITNGKSTEASDEKPENQSTVTTLVEHASNVEMVVDNDHGQGPSRQEDAPQKDLHPGPTTQVPYAEGDSSFAMREPVSGLITYSGQIACAGSTSLHSDSSTTSARSVSGLITYSGQIAYDHGQDPSRQEDAPQKDLHPGPTTQVPYAEGDSSFAMREPVSGLITYSGQIAYAGSTSLRSDSSTTSARSFAFPVLQSEWNSSPVRMQKADRRRTRNHKFWRNGFFCCRF